MTITLVLLTGCRSKEPARPQYVDPSFLELVSLSSSIDDTHAIAVKAPDGSTWYREADAGLDLRHCDLKQIGIRTAYDGSWGLTVDVKRSHWEDLYEWSWARIGKEIGFVLDGHLVATGQLKAALTGLIEIPGFKTSAEANEGRERLRAAGAALGAPGRSR